MVKRIKSWFDVHEDEAGLFFWTMLLLLLIRSSGIVFNNFTETAFLKRFGVEYLPVVYMLNSIITFVVMGLLAGVMARVGGNRMLARVLVFCSVSVAALRLIIPYDIALLYPLLFILRAQYEILLGLLFWNLANDLFNIRQSRRLFPLIVAGGVAGEILGSFSTPLLGQLISINNLMLVYSLNTLLAFLAITRMRHLFPGLLVTPRKAKEPARRPGLGEQFGNIRELVRETPLVPVLILLTLLPNIIIPVLNYQFNYAVNSRFATETGLLQFFGYFKGVMNMVSLCLLLFVGRVYNRVGLPVALMFHPFNYLLVFTAFLLRFDVFSAIYARLSTNVIRTTFNKPVTDVLMGIFPASYRSRIRPFLRGTVVRVGLFAGSGMILLSENVCHPRYLTLFAVPMVVAWLLTTLYLKRHYSGILSGLLSRDMLDLKSIDDRDVPHLFKDPETCRGLLQTFLAARGQEALWHARLLRSLSLPDLDHHMVSVLEHQDTVTRTALLDLISDRLSDRDVRILVKMADPEDQALFLAVIRTLKRNRSDIRSLFSREFMEKGRDPEIRAFAAACLSGKEPDRLRDIVAAWLASGDDARRRAGVIAAGGSEDPSHVPALGKLLRSPEQEPLFPLILQAIHSLEPGSANEYAAACLYHGTTAVRQAALDVTEITDRACLANVIPLLGDCCESIREKTEQKIRTASFQDGRLLIESLNLPGRRHRQGIFRLLESLDITDHDAFLFAREQIRRCYVLLAVIRALKTGPGTRGNHLLGAHQLLKAHQLLRAHQLLTAHQLLRAHLEQQIHDRLEGLLRIMAIQDVSGKFRIVFRNVFSADARQKANALELLDGIMTPSLVRLVMPLLDGTPPAKALAGGRKTFALPDFKRDTQAAYQFLMEADNPVTRMLAANCLENRTEKGDTMETENSVPDKILHLKQIRIFKKLSVNELAAIASIARTMVFQPGDIVFREKDVADTMYLIIDGELSLMKNEKKLPDRLFRAGESIGEAGLLLDEVRLLTLIAETRATLLVIHKQEFLEIVREYPQISLEIAIAMAGQVRELLEQFGDEYTPANQPAD